MEFGDRILYDNGSESSLGVYLKEISTHEALVRLDDDSIKKVLPKEKRIFVKNKDNRVSAQALRVAD